MTRAALCLWLLSLVACMALAGCGSSTEAQVRVQRQTRTVVKEVRQEINPQTGEIVQLGKTTVTLTNEDTGETRTEQVTLDAPQVVGAVGALVRAGATALGGPVAGQAAGVAVDWLSTLIGGGTTAAVTAGGGYMALKRKNAEIEAVAEARDEAERHRDQLIDSVESAREELPREADLSFCKALGRKQDDDLQRYIQRRTHV